MAFVGISIPPPEPGTSPVSSKKNVFSDGNGGQYESLARSNSTAGSAADGAAAAAAGQRLMRKRGYSFHAGTDWKSVKRRRHGIVPPTKFLLGGNICDPLNLGSLNDEEANRIANANTPVSSPMPTPKYRKERIEVIIPSDVSDPLGLNGPEQALLSPSAQRRRKNKRKRKHPSGHAVDRSVSVSEPAGRLGADSERRTVSESADATPAPAAVQLDFQPCTDVTPTSAMAAPEPVPAVGPGRSPAAAASVTPARAGRPHGRKSSAEIVSPAVPQPGSRAAFPRPANRGAADGAAPVFRARDAAFQYGNYNRYYGYRNPAQLDTRLDWMKREWFCGLDVLDVGCNVGHITLSLARDYLPRRCVGMDIDASLVKIARRNVKHYQRSGEFPHSMPLLFGDLVPPHKAPGTQFPRNVTFVHANYVLESDALLETVRQEFDTILFLSITKWVHLNFGDVGIRRLFRRAFLSLRPGGRLLLEPQPWASYVKKKKLTPRIWENFHQIRLRPENFPDLLINEIGFERYTSVGRPHHSAKGFSRQLQLFTKASDPTTATDTATTTDTALATASDTVAATTPATDTVAATAPDTDTAAATTPATAPATDTVATTAPATDTVAATAPATDTVAATAPATDTAAATTPATAPATDTVATTAPATDTVAATAPATDTVAATAPATDTVAAAATATDTVAATAPATDTVAATAAATATDTTITATATDTATATAMAAAATTYTTADRQAVTDATVHMETADKTAAGRAIAAGRAVRRVTATGTAMETADKTAAGRGRAVRRVTATGTSPGGSAATGAAADRQAAAETPAKQSQTVTSLSTTDPVMMDVSGEQTAVAMETAVAIETDVAMETDVASAGV